MIQDQLVEYVSSQMKLGISRDAIKSALVGVGWQTADVEDTLKKVEGDKTQPAVMAAQPTAMAQKPSVQMGQSMPLGDPLSRLSSPLASFSPSDIVGGTKNTPSQPVRMSDFVSGPAQAQSPAKSFFDKKPASAEREDLGKMMSGASEYPPKAKGGKIMAIIEAVVIVGLAALSGFLYFQNNTLGAKVNLLGGQSSDVTSQVSNLTAQVQTFTASNANLTAQVASLTAENTDLQTSLSFVTIPFAAPSIGSSTPSAAITSVQVNGVLHGGGSVLYFVTTASGVKVYVKNSNSTGISTALAPLLGTNVQLSGTHLLGSALLTVLSINGLPVIQNVSSTASSASSTPSSTPGVRI
jgi:hypothetical protein